MDGMRMDSTHNLRFPESQSQRSILLWDIHTNEGEENLRHLGSRNYNAAMHSYLDTLDMHRGMAYAVGSRRGFRHCIANDMIGRGSRMEMEDRISFDY
mmetsp:Transcript_16484/g.22947  ORF Transcript_16484/g.22947 Transcript_16484/m.22947 type:complete len:98 (-) Transcript_16484:307-600(-)